MQEKEDKKVTFLSPLTQIFNMKKIPKKKKKNLDQPSQRSLRTVSPDILPTTSPVFVSISKKATSCLKIVFKYKPLIRAACRSPVTIQQATSNKNKDKCIISQCLIDEQFSFMC